MTARFPRWQRLERLLAHAEGQLEDATEIAGQAQAIQDQRLLLEDPDPVPPLCEKVTTLLREKLTSCREQYQAAHDAGMAMLKADDNWPQLTPEQKHELLLTEGLTVVPDIDTADEGKVLASLDAMPLSSWEDRLAALPARFNRVQLKAAELMEPEAAYVKVQASTLHSEDEIRDWVKDLEQALLDKSEGGKRPVFVH